MGHYSDDLQQYAEAESNFSDTKQYASVLPVGQAESWSDSDYSDDFESDDFEDNDSDEFDDFDRDAFDDDSSDESNDFESDAFDSDAFDDADVESVDADDFSESNPFDDETEEDDDFISPVSASENTFGSADTFDSAATSDDSDPYNDPELAMDTARFLFDGFSSDLSTLKSRYRELAKQYHPDSGGSNGLMQCINHVYDELCDQLK